MTQFFRQGRIPTGDHDAEAFVRRVSSLSDGELKNLALEIDALDGIHLHQFFHHVLSKVTSPDVLSLVYFSSPAISNMNYWLVCDHLELLQKLFESKVVGQNFFESAASSLIRRASVSTGRTFLPCISYMFRPKESLEEVTFHPLAGELDEALAKNISRSMSSGELYFDDFEKTCAAFRRVSLPKSFSTLLQGKLDCGTRGDAKAIVRDMFMRNCLQPDYIKSARDILGDDSFVRLCLESLDGGRAIESIVKLSEIMGESTFHTPEILGSLAWSAESESPPKYIQQFRKLGFCESKLPILAGFVCDNIGKSTFLTGKNTEQIGFVIDVLSLAVRMGKSREALLGFVSNIQKTFGMDDEQSPSTAINSITELRHSKGRKSVAAIRCYSVLVTAIEILGIHELHGVAPDAPASLIIDVVAGGKINLSSRQLSKMFPHAKGRIIENDLGM